jgi:muramoyltetrapeptide carboxypeptidase LdcA involved in peptidoglycan recycling
VLSCGPQHTAPERSGPGRATGPLVGGNLTLISTLMGHAMTESTRAARCSSSRT